MLEKSTLLKIYRLIIVLMFKKFKHQVPLMINIFEDVRTFNNIVHLITLPESAIHLLIPKNQRMPTVNNIIIMNKKLSKVETKYCLLTLSHLKKRTVRLVNIVYLNSIPKNVILCSYETYFNIKHSLNILPYSPKAKIRVNFQNVEHYDICPATKIVINTISSSHITNKSIMENFMEFPRIVYKNDLISIDYNTYSCERSNDIVYIKLKDLEYSVEDKYGGYMIDSTTNVYHQNRCCSFKPSIHFNMIDNSTLTSIRTVIPFGLEKYAEICLKWFQPFLTRTNLALQPIFLISGSSGVGKSVLINGVSRILGMSLLKFDCSTFVNNSLVQIQANYKSVFNKIRENSPVIVQFHNIQLLCSEADGNDCEQQANVLMESIKTLKNLNFPVIIIFTCTDIEDIRTNFTSLTLDNLHINLPNEIERKNMIHWLSNVLNMNIKHYVLHHIINQTSTLNLSDLSRLLISLKKIEESDLTIEHINKLLQINESTGISWEDVGGVEEIKRSVLGSLRSRNLGLRRNGLLLYGPPGTGKTLLAKAVANHCGRSFLPVNGPELLNMYVGQSEANIRKVFSKAKEMSPCILFFDELDSLAPNRGNKSDSGGVMDRVVSQLLAEMDNMENDADVFMLAATNRPDLLDPAFVRPGRLDKMLYVGPCQDDASKIKVIQAQTRRFLMENINYDKLIEYFPKEITGAHVYAVCSAAWFNAAKELIVQQKYLDNVVIVQQSHIIDAIQTVFPKKLHQSEDNAIL